MVTREDLPLDKKTVENRDWDTGTDQLAEPLGCWDSRPSWAMSNWRLAAGPSGHWAIRGCGPCSF